MYFVPLDEGIGSHEGLVEAKYAKLLSSPRQRSKVYLGELRKEDKMESHANPGLNTKGKTPT